MIKVKARLADEIYQESKAIAKTAAGKLEPKSGSSVESLRYYINAGQSFIKKIKAEKNEKTQYNYDTYSVQLAKEKNAPIEAEALERINQIIEITREHINNGIDARIAQAQAVKSLPMKDSNRTLLQMIRMMIECNADITDADWKLWEGQVTGDYWAERVLISLAKMKDVVIIPVSDPDPGIDRLEQFRGIANIAIDDLGSDSPRIIALSFYNIDNSDSPIAELCKEIDSDLMSKIPKEKLTILKRLKNAKEHAFNNDDVEMSAKISVFIERNEEKLATPAELNESLFAEAEKLVQLGMAAKKRSELLYK